MQSRPLYVLAGLLAILFALIGLLIPRSLIQEATRSSMELSAPLWHFLGWVGNNAQLVSRGVMTVDQLEKENRFLKKEHARLLAENMVLQKYQAENQRLREQLNYKNEAQFKLIPCRVISRNPSSWWNNIIIDRGYADTPELAPGQPVITPRGLVGKTGIVRKNESSVILIMDENFKVSAEVEGTRARGLVIGDSTHQGAKPLCRITYVSRETPIPLQARVFTSGLGGAFPPGIVIGTVLEAPELSTERNSGLYRDGIVEPSVDLEELRELFIIVGLESR